MILTFEPLSYLVVIGHPDHIESNIEIRRIHQQDGTWLWLIKRAFLESGSVLNQDFEWEFNSSPSNRSKDELIRTRYTSFDEALAHLQCYVDDQSRQGSQGNTSGARSKE